MVRHAGSFRGGFHIRDIGLQLVLAFVFHRSGAGDRHERQDCAAHHRLFEVLRVIFGKGSDFLLEDHQLLIRPRFIPIEALPDVSKKAGLGILPVSHDLDPTLHLLTHAVGNRLRQNRIQLVLVVGLTGILRFQEIKEAMRSWQAADMRRLYVMGILLQRHH